MAQEDFIPIGEVKQEVKEEEKEEEERKKAPKKPKQEVKKKAKKAANTNTGVIYLGKPFYHFTLDVRMWITLTLFHLKVTYPTASMRTR